MGHCELRIACGRTQMVSVGILGVGKEVRSGLNHKVSFQVSIWEKNVKNRQVSFWQKSLRPQVSFCFVSRYPYIQSYSKLKLWKFKELQILTNGDFLAQFVQRICAHENKVPQEAFAEGARGTKGVSIQLKSRRTDFYCQAKGRYGQQSPYTPNLHDNIQ